MSDANYRHALHGLCYIDRIIFTGAMFFGFATGILSPILSAWTVDLSEDGRGRAMATMYIAMEAGIGLGALLSVAIFANDVARLPLAFSVMAGFGLAALIYAVVILRKKERKTMLFDDSYRTIESSTEGFFKDRGSKFYAFAFPIHSETDPKPLLAALREQHPKAAHHCYAYRLGLDRNQYRANDDGEPTGSAGRPILNTLYSRDLTNVLLVVVRYFGGILLGVPGLINAYKTASELALDAAVVLTKYVCDAYEITFPYEATSEVNRVIKTYDLEIMEQKFEMECTFTVLVRKTLLNQAVPAFEDIEKVQIEYLRTR